MLHLPRSLLLNAFCLDAHHPDLGDAIFPISNRQCFRVSAPGTGCQLISTRFEQVDYGLRRTIEHRDELSGGRLHQTKQCCLQDLLRRHGRQTLDAFSADAALRQALGEEFCQAYENLRRRQWQRERGEISDTERRACLDC